MDRYLILLFDNTGEIFGSIFEHSNILSYHDITATLKIQAVDFLGRKSRLIDFCELLQWGFAAFETENNLLLTRTKLIRNWSS